MILRKPFTVSLLSSLKIVWLKFGLESWSKSNLSFDQIMRVIFVQTSKFIVIRLLGKKNYLNAFSKGAKEKIIMFTGF